MIGTDSKDGTGVGLCLLCLREIVIQFTSSPSSGTGSVFSEAGGGGGGGGVGSLVVEDSSKSFSCGLVGGFSFGFLLFAAGDGGLTTTGGSVVDLFPFSFFVFFFFLFFEVDSVVVVDSFPSIYRTKSSILLSHGFVFDLFPWLDFG